MKLKERLVAAIAGFALAIVLILSLETWQGLTFNHRQSESSNFVYHGSIKSKDSAGGNPAHQRRNLQKTDSSGLSEQQPVEDQPPEVQWKSSRPVTIKVCNHIKLISMFKRNSTVLYPSKRSQIFTKNPYKNPLRCSRSSYIDALSN